MGEGGVGDLGKCGIWIKRGDRGSVRMKRRRVIDSGAKVCIGAYFVEQVREMWPRSGQVKGEGTPGTKEKETDNGNGVTSGKLTQ